MMWEMKGWEVDAVAWHRSSSPVMVVRHRTFLGGGRGGEGEISAGASEVEVSQLGEGRKARPDHLVSLPPHLSSTCPRPAHHKIRPKKRCLTLLYQYVSLSCTKDDS